MGDSFFLSKRNLKISWNIFCIIITITTSILQLQNYLIGEDTTTVSYQPFNEGKRDLYPSIGLCFSNVLIDEKLKQYGIIDPNNSNWTARSLKHLYSYFLGGYYWHEDLLQIDYNDVSKNISDYIVSYDIFTTKLEHKSIYRATEDTTNSSSTDCKSNTCSSIPNYKEFSFLATKCFSLGIPFIKDQTIFEANLEFKKSIFNNGERPAHGNDRFVDDYFTFVPHYPNQFGRHFLLGQRNWPVRNKNISESYTTQVNIRSVEIVQRRNKYQRPCNENLEDYDENIIHWITNKIGCQPPYWNYTSVVPLCKTKEELQRASTLMLLALEGDLKSLKYTEEPPCRGLEQVQFDFRDIDIDEGKHTTPTVKFEIDFKAFSYKKVTDVRSIDIESLIGNKNMCSY